MPNVGLEFAKCMATCAKASKSKISYLIHGESIRTSMNHDEPTFLVVASQQGVNQLATTTPIKKALSNYQVTRKSPNASCQVPTFATPGVRRAVCPAGMATVASFDIL